MMERFIVLIDHSDYLFGWYQDLIYSLRDLDAQISYGNFKRKIQDSLEQDGVTLQVSCHAFK